jgi:hypothetical protein
VAAIQLALFRTDGLPGDRVAQHQIDLIAARLLTASFSGQPGSRYGFWRPQRTSNIVFGSFAHETSEAITDYRSTNEGVEQVLSATNTFEHYAFVAAVDEQIALLQRRRLPQTKALTNQEVIRDFALYLDEAVRPVTNRFVGLRPFEEDMAEEEVRELLGAGRVIRLRVGQLAHRRVPDDVDLTNPDPDAQGVLHTYVNHDFERNVSEVTLQANVGDASANVSNSFYAKGALAAGRLEEVEVVIDDRIERRVRENRRATIEAEEPLTPELVVQLVERVLRHEYQVVAIHDPQTTLFGPEGR